MNAKLWLKMVFFIVMVLLLVLMGMYNRGTVDFTLPPILKEVIKQPAAIMYSAFFAVGVLTGAVLVAGIGKGGGRSSRSEK